MQNQISQTKGFSKRLISWQKKYAKEFVLLAVLSIIIGYLLSPKILFQQLEYHEGDIIRETIVIDEDSLIPDQISTKLKREKLLKELGAVYDFDPVGAEKTSLRINKAFQITRDTIANIEKQNIAFDNKNRQLGVNYFSSTLGLAENKKEILLYQKYKGMLERQLQKLGNEIKLSSNEFEKKKSLDFELRVVGQLLKDLEEKEGVIQQEIANYEKNFLGIQTESDLHQVEMKERKSKAIRDFFDMLQIDISKEELERSQFPFYEIEIEDQLISLLTVLLNQKIVASKLNLKWESDTKNQIRDLISGESLNIQSVAEFSDLIEVQNQIVELSKDIFTEDETGKVRTFVVFLAQKLISPNVTENKLEYEKRKEKLTQEMSPVFFSVKQGEIIARAGDRATPHQVELIKGYYEVISNQNQLPQMLGIMLIVLFSLTLVFYSFHVRGIKSRLTFKNLLVIGVAIVLTLILIKVSSVIGEMVETRYDQFHNKIYKYMFPVALSSMLVGILIGFESALLVGLLTSLFVSIMMQGSLYYFFFAMMGSLVASLPVVKFESRYSLILHGLKISLVNIPVIFFLYLVEKTQIGAWIWSAFAMAFFGGFMTSLIVSILLPFFETLFDITTNLKLLELSNMNHPALKQLIFKAPGTYQHSIVVGNLVETAATRIGANPLLARVGAYYHDIGKGVESHYYIENQPQKARNIHDDMDPYDSAKVIIDHLKKGADLADQHRLGKSIRDILLQHHGTTLVKYFFHKAQQMTVDAGNPKPVEELPFRYLGPKPQSLEAALVMLGDVSEASTRSIDKPTPEKISKMVNKVCWAILEDGELDDSGMNLNKFRVTIDTYTQVLISIHHNRIKYPDAVNFAYLNSARYHPEKNTLS
ncbi:MAG: HDIG domain-containing protein [Deltaproteobacteria bacterium]|nr:HDIG domain-containing protein [Deltaproteobacteria bacterium]